MFDVGFSELVVCGIVALVVIGPERLPKVARTLGVVFGRLQRYAAQVKADINREMEMAELGKVKSELESAARSLQGDIESHTREVEREMHEARSSIERTLDTHAEAAHEPDAPMAPESSPQLELGIEEPPQSAPRDKASG